MAGYARYQINCQLADASLVLLWGVTTTSKSLTFPTLDCVFITFIFLSLKELKAHSVLLVSPR